MSEQKKIRICKIGNHQTIDFACEETVRYLQKLINQHASVSLELNQKYYSDTELTIWIGLINESGSLTDNVKAAYDFNDEIHIDIINGKGIIGGTNPRSVLLAAYRFLTELGFRWIRPGADGEFVPDTDLFSQTIKVHEKPSYTHRGICIEGANSFENVRDIIDWMPKLGFNAYFFQFREAYTFFERWYNHSENPFRKPEGFSFEKARNFIRLLENEMAKRSILYHAVGHGWTCEPLGLNGLGWDPVTDTVDQKYRQYLALLNGKRELFQGIPLNTSLCYSNSEARKIMAESVVEYLENNPAVDILHFWLADDMNNQCECDACKTVRPSDFYVMMLNELDELLTQKEIKTKIVFLIYFELLWPPEKEKIKNPERFILMFAPITRSYNESFQSRESLPALPDFERNKISCYTSVAKNTAFLNAWQKIFRGDSFDFDYHMGSNQQADPGQHEISNILYQDIVNLKKIGLNGFISCQVQRSFFPTGLAMTVLGGHYGTTPFH